jgi:hypothetical protein
MFIHKKFFLNLLLLIFSTFFIFFILEILLILFGPYNNLANTNLNPSISIYERPSSSYQKQKHPDLNYINTYFFDSEGVQNKDSNSLLASEQKNIIGFFGDSMIENIFVDPKYNFVNLLNSKIISEDKIINFGVGGYSLDQTFLRYLKYSNYDFKIVICYINPGDNVTRGILKFDNNDGYEIINPKFSFFEKFIGRLNISYFTIDAFYKIRANFFENHTLIDKSNYNKILSNRFYRNKYNSNQAINDKKNFVKILRVFKQEVERRNSKFLILLYPDENLINFFKSAIDDNKFYVDYYILNSELSENSALRFKNDGHWNEMGNIKLSQNIINIFKDYPVKFSNDDFTDILFDLKSFYEVNR